MKTRVLGLTIDQVRAAVAGTDTGLRDAFEEIGRRCSMARREAGDFRRTPKKRGTAVEQAPQKPEGDADQDARAAA